MIRQLAIVFIFLFCIFSCTQDNTAIGILKKMEKTLDKNPNQENYNLYFTRSSELIQENKEDRELVKSILERTYEVALEHQQYANASAFLMPLIKDYPADPHREQHLIKLIELMVSLNKEHAAKALYYNYKEQYPEAPLTDNNENLLSDLDGALIDYIDTMFQRVFQNPDEFGLNRTNALKFVDVAEAFALSDPDHPNSPYYLYRAGEVARSIRTLPKAMSIYDWILESYPDYEKTPTVLFLKGFILENDIQDLENARKVYEEFLANYPDHELASSVKFLIENLGKSDEEILEFIESQRSKTQTGDENS